MLSKTSDKSGLFWEWTNSEDNLGATESSFSNPVLVLAQQMSIEKKNMFAMLLRVSGFSLHKHLLQKLFLTIVSDPKPRLELP